MYLRYKRGFPGGSVVKNSPTNAGDTGDTGSIPGLERSPGERNGNSLQYSYLENSMDRGAWWATMHGITELNMTERAHTHVSIHKHTILAISISLNI